MLIIAYNLLDEASDWRIRVGKVFRRLIGRASIWEGRYCMVVSSYSFPVSKISSIFHKRLHTQKKSFYIILIQNLFEKGA